MIRCSSLWKNSMHSITSDAKKYLNEINLNTDNIYENYSSTEEVKQIKTQVKTKNINELKRDGKIRLSMVNTLFVLATLM